VIDGTLVAEIVDDGIGGADSEGGTGLRGLGRSRRSSEWSAANLDSRWQRHPGTSGAAVRVAIAEDSVLLRKGVAQL
jgi:type 1 glutamine amidotransferase